MELKSIIETILFVHGEAISVEKIAKITKKKKEEVHEALDELEKDYHGRGLVLLKKDDSYQIGSNPQNSKIVEEMAKNEFSEELSRAAVETLAIIAYKGPLTRVDIEFVRGVNSSFTVRNLMMRGLIERIDNPKDARSYLYRVSFDFLKYFGLKSIEELPQFKEFKETKIEFPQEPKTAVESEPPTAGEARSLEPRSDELEEKSQ